MAGSSITLYELWRRMERQDSDLRERFANMDARISATARDAVQRDVYEERQQATLTRVVNLEGVLDAARIYRRNMTVAIIASVIASLGAVTASMLAVLVH